ncbi:related to glycerol-3-phosphate dehydrogenase precursor [Cephalotrichum gorgonifer]|uniref:Glycerol-3-phosphate dehydrogenase n=1 Tax=Cephalotrichum gorgonifer TaxID=2041049 RepID=A0AAE8N4D3_9PEZI|nr:related to glycerol-3-phosphate dehydrogenase precursor [Cephalotrichum gorgonifer]
MAPIRFQAVRRWALPATAGLLGGAIFYSYRPREIPGFEPPVVPHPIYGADGTFRLPKFPRIRSREEQITRLRRSSEAKDDEYDMLIIGGGATGAGVALDAATRGLKVAIVERDDFSSGTSSKSTKLVHGGVRYLEKAVWNLDYSQYQLVREALKERKYFLKTAPHLSAWLPIMIPIDTWWKAPYFWAGTKAYDFLAGSEGIESSYFLTKSKALEAFPMLKRSDLFGALVYYDGAHNDSRMNVSLAMTAALYGATVVNHMEVTGLLKNDRGKLCGATVRDNIPPRDGQAATEIAVKAKCVVNCTGPFVDSIRKMDDPSFKDIVAPSSGVHIMLPGYFTPANMGLIDPSTSDGRVIFFLPWQGNTIAGTTDEPCSIGPNPLPDEEAIQWILSEIRHYIAPDINVRRGDVLAAWSGIRPLVKDPKAKNTESLVRNHLINISPSGLLTCAGGKWTTYRQMAEECVDEAIAEFGLNTKPFTNAPSVSGSDAVDDGAILDGTCQTHHVRLIGAHGFSKTLFIPLIQHFGVETDVARHLTESYGDRAWAVAALCQPTEKRFPARGERISQLYPFVDGEVRYAVRHEYAQTAVDVLARRTRLAFLNAQAALEALPRVIDIMAQELKWDKARQDLEWTESVAFLESMGLPQPMLSSTRKQVEQGKLDFTSSREWSMYSRHDGPTDD